MPRSSSYTRHSEESKNQFVGAMTVEPNIKKHAAAHGIPYETARKIWRKYQETGSIENLLLSGRPKKITPAVEKKIAKTARAIRRMPFEDIGNQMDPRISARSVGRVLDKEGLHRRVARVVPYLTEDHKAARLAWAERLASKTDRQWAWVIWSDECYIHLDGGAQRVWVTRTSEEVYDQDCLVPRFKQSPIRVMVWGCIAHDWKGPLIVLEYPGGRGGGMTAERYQKQVLQKVLEDALADVKKQRGSRARIEFQQDGPSCHTAKSTKKWLENHKIPLFPHPASSPDLSPIEPAWHELKKRIRLRQLQSSSFESLKTAILEEWEAMPMEDINKYTRGMRARVQAVLEAQGGHTRY
ncbi:unnamed protein product [Mycena citricolor]|uniref:Transposase n=1 Tax=Mycena citricolor TaxID=2018698 RepID=A0AAD2JU79_9AGAR|nr:unnamed protein product [Mycena citricolor]